MQSSNRSLSIALSAEAQIWKRFIDIGVFDDSYPHRLNACFNLLSSNNNYFSLKDLVQKGHLIFSYLSLNVEHGENNNFTGMDLFKSFDRSGGGQVTIEDFIVGIIEKLNALKNNKSLLENIADEVLSVECRCAELTNMLEKGSINGDNFPMFTSNLKALSYSIRTQIRQLKTKENMAAISTIDFIK